ncbi:MAG: holo-ACP synthase [Phycisphaerae bacterium]|nr:holo-ACP synthase [Phycisphaerae bacterium]
MDIVGHGIDLIECDRIAAVYDRHGERFLRRLLTPAERAYVMGRKTTIPHLAGRFAVKEAILKVLGTGWRGAIAWRDMEILNDRSGEPRATLTDECARIAADKGITRILITITHTPHYAAASAIGVAD